VGKMSESSPPVVGGVPDDLGSADLQSVLPAPTLQKQSQVWKWARTLA